VAAETPESGRPGPPDLYRKLVLLTGIRLLVGTALLVATALSAAGTAIAAEKTVTLAVKGMYCSACPYTIVANLSRCAG